MCSQTRWSRWNIRISHPVIWILCWINNANAGFIDPDTPIEFQTMKPFTIGDNHEYELVSEKNPDEYTIFLINFGTNNRNQLPVFLYLERFSLTSLTRMVEMLRMGMIHVGVQ